jgi:Skp family chaperone for outer membrane proteins
MLELGKEYLKFFFIFNNCFFFFFRTHPAVRNRRQFTFNEKGKYVEKANRERAKAKLEKLQEEISRIAKTTGIAVENKAAIIQPKKFFVC